MPLPDAYAEAGELARRRGVRGGLGWRALRALGLESLASAKRTLDHLVLGVTTPFNIIDLVAILPISSTGTSITVLRVLRLSRVARLAHLSNRLVMVRLLTRTLLMSGEALLMLALLLLILCTFFGTVVFFVEGGEWDPVRRNWFRPSLTGESVEVSPFRSIPTSMWWAIVTVATVGCESAAGVALGAPRARGGAFPSLSRSPGLPLVPCLFRSPRSCYPPHTPFSPNLAARQTATCTQPLALAASLAPLRSCAALSSSRCP